MSSCESVVYRWWLTVDGWPVMVDLYCMKAAIAVVCQVLQEFAEPRVLQAKTLMFCRTRQNKTTCLQTKEHKRKRKWVHLIQPIFNTYTRRMHRTSFLLIYWVTAEVLLTQKLQVKLLWSFTDLAGSGSLIVGPVFCASDSKLRSHRFPAQIA